MIFPRPQYRPSQFRHQNFDDQRNQLYMTDQGLADDPRMRRMSGIEQQLVRQYIDALPAGATVADVPCGNGRMSQWVVSRPDLSLVALDYGLNMLRAVESRQIPAILPRRVRADIVHLPLADKSVDFLINMRLLHHVPDRDTQVAMLRELARVCRGTIITSYWTTHSWRYLRRRLLGKSIRGFPISPAYYRGLCAQAGLTIQRVVYVRRWYEEQCLAVCRAMG